MTEAITVPDELTLTPQEWRVFTALHEWADPIQLTRAVNGYTSFVVIVSKLRRKLAPHGLVITTRPIGPRNPNGHKRSVEYKLERAQIMERAA